MKTDTYLNIHSCHAHIQQCFIIVWSCPPGCSKCCTTRLRNNDGATVFFFLCGRQIKSLFVQKQISSVCIRSVFLLPFPWQARRLCSCVILEKMGIIGQQSKTMYEKQGIVLGKSELCWDAAKEFLEWKCVNRSIRRVKPWGGAGVVLGGQEAELTGR